MSAWAKPGVKVVCVDASFAGFATDVLVERAIYTIAAVVADDGRSSPTYSRETVGVILGEVRNPHHARGAFALARFRPLITHSQEDDVALFRKLLVPEGADA